MKTVFIYSKDAVQIQSKEIFKMQLPCFILKITAHQRHSTSKASKIHGIVKETQLIDMRLRTFMKLSQLSINRHA